MLLHMLVFLFDGAGIAASSLLSTRPRNGLGVRGAEGGRASAFRIYT